MNKIILFLVLSLLLPFASAQVKDKPKDFDIENIDFTSCFESCRRQMEENCATYPNSPLCPEDISRRCELNCQQSEFVLLNEEFTLDIGQSVKVKDYNDMEITLVDIRSECVKDSRNWTVGIGKPIIEKPLCFIDKVTSNLKIKNDGEEIFLDLKNKESKKVFGVRIDAITYIAAGPQPHAIVFGVYEKGVGGFWARISKWFKIFFG